MATSSASTNMGTTTNYYKSAVDGTLNIHDGRITIACWVLTTASEQTGYRAWFEYGRFGEAENWGVFKSGNGNNKIQFSSNGTSSVRSATNTVDNDSSWHHIAAVFDPLSATKFCNIYYDGVLVINDTTSIAAGGVSTNRVLSIGANTAGSEDWESSMAYVQAYDAALTQDQISELIYRPHHVPDNLVLSWDILSANATETPVNGVLTVAEQGTLAIDNSGPPVTLIGGNN